MDLTYPQRMPWILCTPPRTLASVMAYVMHKTTFPMASPSQVAAAGGHWSKWAKFYMDMSLNPILVSYRYPVPILNAFA